MSAGDILGQLVQTNNFQCRVSIQLDYAISFVNVDEGAHHATVGPSDALYLEGKGKRKFPQFCAYRDG